MKALKAITEGGDRKQIEISYALKCQKVKYRQEQKNKIN